MLTINTPEGLAVGRSCRSISHGLRFRELHERHGEKNVRPADGQGSCEMTASGCDVTVEYLSSHYLWLLARDLHKLVKIPAHMEDEPLETTHLSEGLLAADSC